jgi:hypothetical protein
MAAICDGSDMTIAGNTLAEQGRDEVKYYGQKENPYNMNVARMDSHGGWIARPEDAERIASRIGGALLFALAAYVVVAAGWNLWQRQGEEFSWPGLVVTLLAIPVMRYLARRKLDLADKLGSRALRADAIEAITCGWLSFVAVVSLVAQALFGFWWIDSVGSLAIVWLLVKEGREAWAGECCDCA